ncbi:extracellular solute-binding protein [Aquicoccus sp.]|uniref:extracellular solute-binding protein n=1 Tax=Aquicoccus sp. TaxID=2055851 RepID=UPI00356B13EE
MGSDYFPLTIRKTVFGATILGCLFLALMARADPRHGISMYGDPGLPPDFVSLPYADPEAPRGGRIVTGNTGGFDSLNPFILKGTAPWQLRFLGYEGLMGRNWDEPFALYGLLAESVETGPNRNWVEFTLREEARFSDGSPVTVEDVIWSFETLGTQGHPIYLSFWTKVESIEQTGPRSVRLTFNTEDRELPLIAGLRPILKKAQWEDRDFTDSGLDTVPIGTGPYVIDSFEPGRNVVMRRDRDYWGRDLPLMQGRANLDEIRIEFYGDAAVMFEAFKAGELTVYRETNAEKWQSAYDFRAVRSGDVVKSEIPSGKPSGMTGFVMNARRAPFDDWRVRAAMIHAFNFEYTNDAITGGRQDRITSYFSGTDLGMRPGPAEGRVRDLLEPFADTLLPGALEGYALPVSDGTARNRKNLRAAMRLLQEAGYQAEQGVMRDASGRPLEFSILLPQGSTEKQAFANIFIRALERIGVRAMLDVVDNAQYFSRVQTFDFDMTDFRREFSLSPGNEQRAYWGSDAADQPGSRNLMGVKSPAIDAMIERMLETADEAEFTAAVRALDRVLMAGRYVIPTYEFGIGRIAHARQLRYPARLPVYGDGYWFMPDVWWWQE